MTETEQPESKPKSSKAKIAGWSACALWVLSIVLSFAIPPSSSLIWIPDTVLLLGFLPLLYICRFSLVWILWGVLTTFIGWFLLLLTCIPDSSLPVQSIGIKHHLAEYHPCWSWQILGIVVTVTGIIRLSINLVKMLISKKQSSNKA